MQTKPLLYGLAGFFIGGLLVATAATTFGKPEKQTDAINNHTNEMSMSEMTDSLRNKIGDDYDSAFIEYMIEHHQSAVDMAKLSAHNAKHNEIKQLSDAIVTAQEKEITKMKRWQKDWGYPASAGHNQTGH